MSGIELQKVFFSNTIYSYLISLAIILTGNLFIRLFKLFFWEKINKFLKQLSESLADFTVDFLEKKILPLFNIILFYLAFVRLDFNHIIHRGIELILFIFALFYMVQIIQNLIIYNLKNYWNKREKNASQCKMIQFIIMAVRIFTWIIAGIVLLENMNVEIKGLLTGLGISGIAFAFAAQKILADIFSYFTIFFDRPFAIGDYIAVDNYRGTVEHIGIKTTRIKSLSGEQLVFSNNDLTNSRINNYGKMSERRINFSVGVEYTTKYKKIKIIPEIIENIIVQVEKTRFDRAHFAKFGDYSLIFEVVYYVKDSDYKVYMNIQEKINLRIKEKFGELDINFAYPTQKIELLTFDQKNQ